ncbi:hypothetical protein [Microbacterium terregens]|uniref:Uncharacterized protein n=1 Tax=Microbacterium terregens TaxID=69363 RepID=A0ABV5T732_9MICO
MSDKPALSVHQRPAFVRALGVLSNVPAIGMGIPASALIAPFLIPLRRAPGRMPWLRILGIWAVVSIVAHVVASLANGTPVLSGSVGQLAVFLLMLAALPSSLITLRSSAQFIGWFAAGAILYFLTIGIDEGRGTFEGLWKYGIAFPVTIVAVYALSLRGTARAWPAFALFAVGALGIFLNFRSHGLICFVAALLLLVKGQNRGGAFRAVVSSLAGLAALMWILPQMVTAGVFGDAVRARTLAQSAEGPLLLGGRTEPPLSIAAILENPIAGWGSAQNLTDDTIAHGSQIAQSLGLGSPSAYLGYWVRSDGFISLHSVFFSSWVEGGILAAVFPALLVAFFAYSAIVVRGRWSAVVILVSIQSAWDILFSPWSTNKGVAVAAACIACAWAIRETRAARTADATRLPALTAASVIR